MLCIEGASCSALVSVMNSDSVVNSVTRLCCFDDHDTAPPNVKTYPDIGFQERSDIPSASEYPCICSDPPKVS